MISNAVSSPLTLLTLNKSWLLNTVDSSKFLKILGTPDDLLFMTRKIIDEFSGKYETDSKKSLDGMTSIISEAISSFSFPGGNLLMKSD